MTIPTTSRPTTLREVAEWCAKICDDAVAGKGKPRDAFEQGCFAMSIWCAAAIRRRAVELSTTAQESADSAVRTAPGEPPAAVVPDAMPEEPRTGHLPTLNALDEFVKSFRKLRAYATAQRERGDELSRTLSHRQKRFEEKRERGDGWYKHYQQVGQAWLTEHTRSDLLAALLREALPLLNHTRCLTDDALKCPACSLEARIEKELR